MSQHLRCTLKDDGEPVQALQGLRYLRRYSWNWIWSRMPSFASCRCQFCQFDRPKTREYKSTVTAGRFRTEHFQSCFLCVTSQSLMKLGELEELRKHKLRSLAATRLLAQASIFRSFSVLDQRRNPLIFTPHDSNRPHAPRKHLEKNSAIDGCSRSPDIGRLTWMSSSGRF